MLCIEGSKGKPVSSLSSLVSAVQYGLHQQMCVLILYEGQWDMQNSDEWKPLNAFCGISCDNVLDGGECQDCGLIGCDAMHGLLTFSIFIR
jgi:hypothetical protein